MFSFFPQNVLNLTDVLLCFQTCRWLTSRLVEVWRCRISKRATTCTWSATSSPGLQSLQQSSGSTMWVSYIFTAVYILNSRLPNLLQCGWNSNFVTDSVVIVMKASSHGDVWPWGKPTLQFSHLGSCSFLSSFASSRDFLEVRKMPDQWIT